MVRAQLKIKQMAFMLIAVAILFVLVGLFFISFGLTKLKEEKGLENQLESQQYIKQIANTPEFSCGSSYGSQKINCIDFEKLIIIKENPEIYKDFLGLNNIEIIQIFPLSNNLECTPQNIPDCTIFTLFNSNEQGFDSFGFITLCYKVNATSQPENKCALAKIAIDFKK